jgi:hypothetical protein
MAWRLNFSINNDPAHEPGGSVICQLALRVSKRLIPTRIKNCVPLQVVTQKQTESEFTTANLAKSKAVNSRLCNQSLRVAVYALLLRMNPDPIVS